ncbi:MAG: CDP-alcohol phosphatidyltransferase family protein [Chloroflexota bacterium]
MTDVIPIITTQRKIAAWLVHAFTASGAVLGLFALDAIHEQAYITAFWLLAVTVMIDAVDGVLARFAMTKVAASQIDGALLDNIVDYLNYVIVPAFFIIESNLLDASWRYWVAGAITLASAYQFSQRDAKTRDHFFKGFPSYWNIIVFYLFLLQFSSTTNLTILLGLCVLVFVPIKYVYPSRLDYLTTVPWLRRAMLLATIGWATVTAIIMIIYPDSNPILSIFSLSYGALYIVVSLYRTLFPLDPDLIS